MPGRRPLAHAAAAAALLVGAVTAVAGPLTAQPRAEGRAECRVLPANNYWHADVSKLPVERRSEAWVRRIGRDLDLHPDFGPSSEPGPDYGIPITNVTTDTPRVRVRFDYADESDHVGYPLTRRTLIEGGPGSDGDRHAIMLDRDRCRLYETYATRRTSGGWRAGSGATWNLRSNRLRPDGWTSADAAGLPILPGLLRWSEVRAGRVDHAIRFTAPETAAVHLWPARHDAGSGSAATRPPMGARFRLKASYADPSLGRDARVVVRALKTYGLVLADNGSPWFFQGERNPRWPSRLIEDLKQIPASAFVAVDASGLMVDPDSGETG